MIFNPLDAGMILGASSLILYFELSQLVGTFQEQAP